MGMKKEDKMKREYPVTHLEDAPPEPVKEEEGWKKMDIRFVITGEKQGSKNCTMFRALFPPGGSSYET